MSASDFVHLSDGLIVPWPAMLAVLDLERAGHRLHLDGHHVLVERGPGLPPIDESHIDALRRWKGHVWLIVRRLNTPDNES